MGTARQLRTYLFLFLVEIRCVPGRGGGRRERQNPISAITSSFFIVWLLILVKSLCDMPYAENLGSSATVSMGMEIQDLVYYFESLTSILPPFKKKTKLLLIH